MSMANNRFGDIINTARTRQSEETEGEQSAGTQNNPTATNATQEIVEAPVAKISPKAPAQAAKTSQTQKRNGKSSNPDYRHISAYLRRGTHQAAHKKLLEEGGERDLSEVLEVLLDKWIKGNVSI